MSSILSESPLVSIIIPVYNGSNYLEQAIQSALSQTYSNIEILVINDGSKDEGATKAIATSFGDKIRYLEKENGGVASALNMGIEAMKGHYFSWLSHDDYYHPQKIESQIKLLSQPANPDHSIVISNFILVNENGDEIARSDLSELNLKNVRFWLTKTSELNGCTLLIPKNLLLNHKGFNEKLRYTQDYDLWFRMADRAQFLLAKDHLVYSRQHEAQDTRSKQDKAYEEATEMRIKFISEIKKEISFADLFKLILEYKKQRNMPLFRASLTSTLTRLF